MEIWNRNGETKRESEWQENVLVEQNASGRKDIQRVSGFPKVTKAKVSMEELSSGLPPSWSCGRTAVTARPPGACRPLVMS